MTVAPSFNIYDAKTTRDNFMCYAAGWINFFKSLKKYLGVLNMFSSSKTNI
jgi:hypothetical protein